MIKLHCDNHPIELAVNEAIAKTEFSKVDDIYYSTFLLKNSLKIKSTLSLLHTSWIFNTTDFQRWQVLVVFWSLESRIKMCQISDLLWNYSIWKRHNWLENSAGNNSKGARFVKETEFILFYVSWNMFIVGKGGHTPFSRSTPRPF